MLLGDLQEFGPLPQEFLEANGLLPLRIDDGRLVVATWLDAPDAGAVDALAALLGAEPTLIVAPEAAVRSAIRRQYGRSDDDGRLSNHHGSASTHDLLALANEPPVVQYVNLLLAEAADRRASDVHVAVSDEDASVRVRVDGLLRDADPPTPAHAAAVVSRIKVMADLDIAERRMPQDGRIRLRLGDRQLDMRVSCMPILDPTGLQGDSIPEPPPPPDPDPDCSGAATNGAVVGAYAGAFFGGLAGLSNRSPRRHPGRPRRADSSRGQAWSEDGSVRGGDGRRAAGRLGAPSL